MITILAKVVSFRWYVALQSLLLGQSVSCAVLVLLQCYCKCMLFCFRHFLNFLDLTDNDFGDAGLGHVLTALPALKHLRVLDISGTRVAMPLHDPGVCID